MKAVLYLCFFACVPAFLIPLTSKAGSATWDANPATNDWNTETNWTPETVPDEPTDVATFDVSNITAVSMSSYVTIGAIVFDASASGYNIIAHGALEGMGIVNDSAVTQNVDSSANLSFTGHASAGDNIVYTNNGEAPSDGYATVFEDESSAGSAVFVNKGDSSGVFAAYMVFEGHASAGTSTIMNESGAANGAQMSFFGNATAAHSNITVQPEAYIEFGKNSTAANATLNIAGGTVQFDQDSNGGKARVVLSDGGAVTFDGHNVEVSPPTLGSLEGEGAVDLSGQALAIGGNGVSATFSGVISDGGPLVKTGNETLTLTGANTYPRGTTVRGGRLMVQGAGGSATGSGFVQVNAGTLGGGGTIAGKTSIGTGSGSGAFLAPAGGTNKPATLTIQKALTFNSDATYTCALQAGKKKSANDEVVANGVTINAGAQFNLVAKVQGKLKAGTSFTVISNTASTPISGTFANLADGAILTVGNIKLQASYEGGDGNDLTLTVVP